LGDFLRAVEYEHAERRGTRRQSYPISAEAEDLIQDGLGKDRVRRDCYHQRGLPEGGEVTPLLAPLRGNVDLLGMVHVADDPGDTHRSWARLLRRRSCR
jgi:hypothetical protein